MADLADVLPGFDSKPWRHLTYSLEKKYISTAELISQSPIDIARKCPLPLKEVKRMVVALTTAIHNDIVSVNASMCVGKIECMQQPDQKNPCAGRLCCASKPITFVKTLDSNIDRCLGGGFPAGYVSEIVGESAVGKTQFVLGLLLTAQLPPPKGLGRAVMYLSTEDRLNTSRLHQILESHPEYRLLPCGVRPTLDQVYTMSIRNFDQQESVIQYKLPFLIEQNNFGLVVIDSVAANFRVQFPGAAPAVLARRALALTKLGNTLRKLAQQYNIAIVLTNQVADRFDQARVVPEKFQTYSTTPPASAVNKKQVGVRSTQNLAEPPQTRSFPLSQAEKDQVISLDYQQCFFTGWGNDEHERHEALKNPALGLAWASQIDARIALKISDDPNPPIQENVHRDRKRRRHLSVVFAKWTPPTTAPIEYELRSQGLASTPSKSGQLYDHLEDFAEDHNEDSSKSDFNESDEIQEMLDPKYWEDDPTSDDEFLRAPDHQFLPTLDTHSQ